MVKIKEAKYIKNMIEELEKSIEEEKKKSLLVQKRLKEVTKLVKKEKKIASDSRNLFSAYPEDNCITELEAELEELQMKLFDSEISLQKKEKELEMCCTIENYIEEKEKKEEIQRKQDREAQLSPYRLLEVQELERKRISMDLHDTTVQNLTTLVHKTELITKLIDIDPIRAKLELQTSLTTVRNTIKELREVIYDLRPMSIDDLGFTLAVEHFVKQMECDNDKIQIELELEGMEAKNVLPVISMTLYRVIQEAYNNIKKHSYADYMRIKIESDETAISMVIEDNGCGFDTSSLNDKKKNFGLSIMRERINLLSGDFELKSKVGKGTKIVVSVPLVEEEKNE